MTSGTQEGHAQPSFPQISGHPFLLHGDLNGKQPLTTPSPFSPYFSPHQSGVFTGIELSHLNTTSFFFLPSHSQLWGSSQTVEGLRGQMRKGSKRAQKNLSRWHVVLTSWTMSDPHLTRGWWVNEVMAHPEGSQPLEKGNIFSLLKVWLQMAHSLGHWRVFECWRISVAPTWLLYSTSLLIMVICSEGTPLRLETGINISVSPPWHGFRRWSTLLLHSSAPGLS